MSINDVSGRSYSPKLAHSMVSSAHIVNTPARLCRFWVLIAFKDEVLGLVLSAPEVPDDTAIVTGPLSAVASAAFTAAGALSVLNSFGVNLEPVCTT